MISIPRRGLYAITDTELCKSLGLTKAVRLALEGGACVIQYRDKSTNHPRRQHEARELLEICHEFDAPLIINDDVELALEIGADGVHVGKDDIDLRLAREKLGPKASIGVSCYNSVELALDAQNHGVDYVAFGRFFPSSTKPDAPRAELKTVRACRKLIDVPIAAIGGITSQNAPALVDAGVSLLAVIGAVFAHPDPRAAAASFNHLFS